MGAKRCGDGAGRCERTGQGQGLRLEELMDDSVGGAVELELERGGKKVGLQATDLHSITPSCFVKAAMPTPSPTSSTLVII